MRPLLIPLLLLCAILAAADAQQKCARPLLKGAADSEIDFKSNTYYCRSSAEEKKLKTIAVDSIRYDHLKCDEVEGWSGVFHNGTANRLATADSSLTVACVESCIPEIVGEVQTSAIGEEGNLTKVFACNIMNGTDGKYRMKVNGSFVDSPVKCGNLDGYLEADGARFADASDSVELECETLLIDTPPCSLKEWQRPESHFESLLNIEMRKDIGKFWLTCRPGPDVVAIVKYNSYRSKYAFTCDPIDGWRVAGKREIIHEASIPLAAECEPYCAVTGSGIRASVSHPEAHDSVVVSCTNASLHLFYNGEHIDKSATCNVFNGWYTGMYAEKKERTMDTKTPVQFECKEPPVPTTTTKYNNEYTTTTTTTNAPVVAAATVDQTSLIIGVCTAGALLLVGAIVISICCLCKKKRPEPEDSEDSMSRRTKRNGRSEVEDVRFEQEL